jgi:hypothetical protein
MNNMPKKKMVVVDVEKNEWAPIEKVIKKIGKNQSKERARYHGAHTHSKKERLLM